MQIKYDLDKVGIGSRLQEERIRAGHTQESLAEVWNYNSTGPSYKDGSRLQIWAHQLQN